MLLVLERRTHPARPRTLLSPFPEASRPSQRSNLASTHPTRPVISECGVAYGVPRGRGQIREKGFSPKVRHPCRPPRSKRHGISKSPQKMPATHPPASHRLQSQISPTTPHTSFSPSRGGKEGRICQLSSRRPALVFQLLPRLPPSRSFPPARRAHIIHT